MARVVCILLLLRHGGCQSQSFLMQSVCLKLPGGWRERTEAKAVAAVPCRALQSGVCLPAP